MIHKKKVVLLALIAVLVLAALPVYAQTGNVTQGVFSAEADDSLDVHNYGDVEFDTWFGYAGVGSDLSLGYARKLGGIYLGLGYEGNLFTLTNNKSKNLGVGYDGTGNIVQKQDQGGDDGYVTADDTGTDNKVFVLLGLGGMGIKLGVSEALNFDGTPFGWNPDTESLYSPKITEKPGENNKVTYTDELDSYSKVSGFITPSIEWGMTLGKLKPTVSVGAEFAQDAETSKINGTGSGYTTENGVLTGAKQTDLSGYGKGYIAPNVFLGIGYMLKDEDARTLELGLEYGLNIPLYNNEYEAFGKTGSISGTYTYEDPEDPVSIPTLIPGGGSINLENTKTVTEGPKTTVTETAYLALTEISKMTHKVAPYLTYTREVSDEFKMGFSVAIATELTSTTEEKWNEGRYSKSVTYAYDPTQNTVDEITTVGPKTKTEKTDIRVTPRIGVGTVYALLPGKVNLNSGFGVELGVTYYAEKGTPEEGFGTRVYTWKDADGNDREPSKSGPDTPVGQYGKRGWGVENFNWNGIQVTDASLGFTVFFTPKSALDLAIGTGGVNLVFSLKK
jgi:hypothetical protein